MSWAERSLRFDSGYDAGMRRSALAVTFLLLLSCRAARRLPVDAAGTGGAAATGDGGAGRGGAGEGAGGAASDAGDAAGGAGDAGGDDRGDADGPPPITEDEFCALKAEQECQVVSRCLTATMSACVAQRKALCLDAGGRAQSGPRRFRPENAAACIDETATVYGKTLITPVDLAQMNDICGYVYQGGVALLGACTTKYDCAIGTLICDKGFCSNRIVEPANAPCNNPGETCASGAYCAPDVRGVFVCVARGAAGTACDAMTPCLESLRCATTCLDRLAAGQNCLGDDACGAAAPFCDPFAQNRCDLGLTFAAGAPACAAYGGGTGDAASPG